MGQHRECCALRGKGWGKKHATVDYVFENRFEALVAFHILVLLEMERRGYHPAENWFNKGYRGKLLGNTDDIDLKAVDSFLNQDLIYKEHNKRYLEECLDNLYNKDVTCCYFENINL